MICPIVEYSCVCTRFQIVTCLKNSVGLGRVNRRKHCSLTRSNSKHCTSRFGRGPKHLNNKSALDIYLLYYAVIIPYIDCRRRGVEKT